MAAVWTTRAALSTVLGGGSRGRLRGVTSGVFNG
jgi:hypothetical protein